MTEHTYIFIIEDNLPMVIRVYTAFYEQVVFNNHSVHSFHFLEGKVWHRNTKIISDFLIIFL